MGNAAWREHRYKENILRQFREECVDEGPGKTRPHAHEKTKEFKLTVSSPGSTPMIVRLQAKDQKTAQLYAQNRWPNSQVKAA